MKNKNLIRIIIGVILLITLVAGATYAWFAWQSSNVNISGTSGCFDINYDKGQNIGSVDNPFALRTSCSYEGGVSNSVTVSMDSTCNTSGIASINIGTNSFILYDGITDAFTAGSNILAYQVVKVTTETVDGEEVTSETAIDGCNGYINNSSTKSLCEVGVTQTPTTYKVYLYLDCNTVTTTYIGASYSGYIQSVVYQEIQ